MREEIKNFIIGDLLGNRTGIELSTEDDILTDGLIDSLGVMQLIAMIEDRFKIQIPAEDMVIENFRSIRAIEVYIGKRQAG